MKKYTEKTLCDRFIVVASAGGYKLFSEYEGWDIVLHNPNGVVVGIQAKLRLNPKVIAQVLKRPDDVDYRMVLVNGDKQDRNLLEICYHSKIVVLHYNFETNVFTFDKNIGNIFHYRHRPNNRLELASDYTADAGDKSPRTFSKRKIRLVELELLADKNSGFVSYYEAQKLGLRSIPPYFFTFEQAQLRFKMIRRPSVEWPHIKGALTA